MSLDIKAPERKVLFQSDQFEVVSISWTNQSSSPPHNHGWSQCFVLVEVGVFENHLDLGIKKEIRVLEPGEVLSTPVGSKHEMVCKSKVGKTLHVYTPKIKAAEEAGRFRKPEISELQKDLRLDGGMRIEAVKEILSKFKDSSVSTRSPYFMNQLFSGVLPHMLIAEEFSAHTKTTLATFEASPVLSLMESEVVTSLCRQIGWSEDPRCGVSVPGGSSANFMAIHCARQKKFPHIKNQGLSGETLKIFVSSEAHYSFRKACAVLGLGIDNVISVPVDENGRMLVSDLNCLIHEAERSGAIPVMIAATAGTTVLGCFDNIRAISEIAKDHGVWLHVDGAWGGPALFSKNLRSLMDGIELADSMTFDAHKLFGAALTTSFFLTKHPNILLEANDVAGADYLFHDSNTIDRGRLSWQCGRGADAVSFWTIWKNLGSEGLGEFVDRLVGLRDESLAWIKSQERLDLIADPDYLNICVRVRPQSGNQDPQWSKHVRERLKEGDLAFVNYSENRDGTFLRLILAHPYLTFHHVRQILEWALDVK